MDIDVIEIKSKTRKFVNEYLDGFDEFTDQDKFTEMGIVTDEFVFLLKQFINSEFHVIIDGAYFLKNKLSINSIAKFIEQKLAEEVDKKMGDIEINRDSLFFKSNTGFSILKEVT